MKHILITGSTDGIGKLTALKLAKEGNFVAVHGRNETKLLKTVKEIKNESKNDNIIGFFADFSDLDQVASMAKEVVQTMPKIDILISNAGIFNSKTDIVPSGIDVRLVVNYLAPYQLTNAILPLLSKSNTPRIINLSSAAQSPVSFSALKGDKNLGVNEAYAQSKLALTMWSFDFAKNHPNIITIAVNPGSLLNTKMAKEAYGQHWSPAAKGVDILYSLAIDSIHADKSGTYFDNDRGGYNKAHADAYDEVKISQLIRLTNEVLSNPFS